MSSCPLPSIVVRSSSFSTHFITISPLIPPSFVDCCFKRQTKPLMVLSLSSRPSALVGCFHCPPPAHSRRFPWQSSSAVRFPHSRRFDIAVAVSSPHRSDAVGGPPPLRSLPNSRGATHGSVLLLGEGQRVIAVVAAANACLHVVVVVVIIAVIAPAIPLPSPQSRASTVPVARRSAPRESSSSDWPSATRRCARLTAIPRSPAIRLVFRRRRAAIHRRRRRRADRRCCCRHHPDYRPPALF